MNAHMRYTCTISRLKTSLNIEIYLYTPICNALYHNN